MTGPRVAETAATTLTEADVRVATAELRRIVAIDGATLVLISTDAAARCVTFDLLLSDAACSGCVLSRSMLRNMLHGAIATRYAGEFEVIVHDPREG